MVERTIFIFWPVSSQWPVLSRLERPQVSDGVHEKYKENQQTFLLFLWGALASLPPVLDVLETCLLVVIDEFEVWIHADGF